MVLEGMRDPARFRGTHKGLQHVRIKTSRPYTYEIKSGTRGLRRGQAGRRAVAQPRMRLDFPPGGFLRTDVAPAVGASASGGSSLGGSEMASGSVLWTAHKHNRIKPAAFVIDA